jgi:hypothetical protein
MVSSQTFETGSKLVYVANRLRESGTFGEPHIIASLASRIRSTSFQAADLNSDGFDDLLVSSFQRNQIFLSVNGGSDFQFHADIAGNRAIDMDGDRDADLVANFSSTTVWFEQTQDEKSFHRVQVVDQSAFDNRPFWLADIDGDADIDFVTTQSDRVLWRENRGIEIGFSEDVVIAEQFFVGSVFDVDMDGDADIVGYNRDQWLENVGQTRFELHRANVVLAEDLIADIDGNGDADYLSRDAQTWYDTPDGEPKVAIEVHPLQQPTKVADINRDGAPDLIGNDGAYFYVLNEFATKGRFGDPIRIDAARGTSFDLVDIDADGDDDFLFRNVSRL